MTGAAAGDWRLFDVVVVRCTGFAWELVEDLHQPRSRAAASALAVAGARAAELRARAPRLRPPSRGNLARLRNGRALDAGVTGDRAWLDAWNEAARQADLAGARLDEVFDGEHAACHERLSRIAADGRFQRAVAASSPAVLADLRRGRLTNRLCRQLASYVQRFSAKNETTSFFGPINYGHCDEAAATGVEVAWSGPVAITARRTHVASWLLAALVEGIAFSDGIAASLTLRPRAGARDVLDHLLEGADGIATLETLAARSGTSLEKTVTAARSAWRSGRAVHQLDVPATALQPLRDLGRRLASLPGAARGRHLDAVGDLVRIADGFARLDADGAVEACERAHRAVSAHVGEVAPPSGRGQFYADRLPLREECAGDLSLRVGGARARELREEVAGVLDLLAVAAVRTRDRARRQLARTLGRRSLPLWKLAAVAPDTPPRPDPWLTDRVAALAGGHEGEIDLARLAHEPADELAGEALLCSVDLLVAASCVEEWAAGRYDLVLGDIHDTALVTPWALQFHADAAAVEADLAMAIGRLPHRVPLVSVVPARRTGLTPPELPGVTVELGGTSARTGAWKIPFDELVVSSDGTDARLHAPSLSSDVALHNGELDTLVHTAFALPRIRPLDLRMGTHTPRVRWGRVVVQRERWDLPAAELEGLHAARDDRRLLEATGCLWQRHGIAETVFASVPGERKPVLVDAASPLLLRAFANSTRGAASVRLSEMLPGPQALWLRDGPRRHTCELRCVYLRHGSGT